MRWGLLTFVVTFLADQISKYWIVLGLDLQQRLFIDVLPPYLTFKMAWNHGINFGLFAGESDANRWILIAIAVALTVAVLYWVRNETEVKVRVSAGLLAGGAIGNIVDRILYGAVADFLNMSCCGLSNPFAFNIADIAIFVGALGLVFFAGREKPA